MYVRLEDELLDHAKVFRAGRRIGKNGPVITIGLYAMVLLWSNKHLSDGFLPIEVLEGWRATYAIDPVSYADALEHAGFLEKVAGGYKIHDYADHNPSAAAIKRRRRDERDRKRRERANGHV